MKTHIELLKETSDFWDEFYSNNLAPAKPSPFCDWLIDYLPINEYIIQELGCGNGRDTFAFAMNGYKVEGLDQSEQAIKYCQRQLEGILSPKQIGNTKFTVFNLESIDKLIDDTRPEAPNLIYSRFVLHAVSKETQNKILHYCSAILPIGGIVAHEFRTDKDPLKEKGEIISQNERITDHYRRFIQADEIEKSLNVLGFKILYFIEGNGFARYKSEDPVVARIVAVKIKNLTL